jgi:hypothetical protein
MAITTETTGFESIHYGHDGMRKAADYADLRAAAAWGTFMVDSTRYVIVRDLGADLETYMVLTGEQFIEALAASELIDLVAVYRSAWARKGILLS